ncbi:MAG: hypothetical protein GY913_08420 [Proteobacteria bacterium]|nr:hypothetical protein [Pseudomonadota bacterium]MCP4916934.1 hypothetical protein [Pseudomonadota bacterium]
MIVVLMWACGPSAEALCEAAVEVERNAWAETAEYYERRLALTEAELQQARAQVDSGTSDREQAGRSRSTYASRSRSGLTDVRTGELHTDADANAANRRRAGQASARLVQATDAEAQALAAWLEADHEHARTEAGVATARGVLAGTHAPEDGAGLSETTLAAAALQASRERKARCEATGRGASS